MATVEIRIPQLGEGLQEARIVRFMKQPGDSVEKDEIIYEMETDKAIMEIESPTAGVLGEWSAAPDDVLPIGAVIGTIESETQSSSVEPVAAIAATETPVEVLEDRVGPTRLTNAAVPPRTRAYAREKGLTEDQLAVLAVEVQGKLTPDHIDRYLADAPAEGGYFPVDFEMEAHPVVLVQQPKVVEVPVRTRGGHVDIPLVQRQRTLLYRLQRGTEAVIPVVLEMQVEWAGIEAVRAHFRDADPERAKPQPSQFLLFAWCVAQSVRNHPKFRSSLINDTTVRQYDHLNLGIAVARPDDELLLARVDSADALDFLDFVGQANDAIERARAGHDQATDTMQISLTNMAGAGIERGIPLVAAPAVATLFIGSPVQQAFPIDGGGIGFRRVATMVMTFDHRLINGIGGANFLSEVKNRVENVRSEFGI